jgi:hypothetical protein
MAASGYEYGCIGWVMERENGERYIMLTDHGKKYIASEDELQAKIDEYTKAVDCTIDALRLLGRY